MFRSFCITIRPLDGISDELVNFAKKKILSKADHAFAVLEKEGIERHLHAQIYYDQPKRKADINIMLERLYKAHLKVEDDKSLSSQIRVLRQGTRIAYSDWYKTYLLENDLKTDDVNIVYDNVPVNTDDYYPSEAEQDKVKTLATAVDVRFAKLEIEFLEWVKNEDRIIDKKSVCIFLSVAMFEQRTMKVIVKPTDRYNLANALLLYVTRSRSHHNFEPISKDDIKFQNLENYVKENSPEEMSIDDL